MVSMHGCLYSPKPFMIAILYKNINYLIPITLLVITFASIGGFHAGLFNTYLDVLDPKHNYVTEAYDDENSEYVIFKQGGSVSVSCNVKSLEGDRFCGLSIYLSEDLSDGLDLSRYDELELSVSYFSPSQDTKIRVFLKNFDHELSKPDDPLSLKYNAVRFEAGHSRETIQIPTRYFQVETWWTDLLNVDYEHSQVDLTNVSVIELTSHEFPLPKVGEYRITLHSMEFKGRSIDEFSLIWWLFISWLIVSVYLLNRQRLVYISRNEVLKQVSNQDSLTQLLNRRGLGEYFLQIKKEKTSDDVVTLIYLDLDNFKRINDSYGHLAGDSVLIETCKRITHLVNECQKNKDCSDPAIGRISGDEFVLLLLNCKVRLIPDLSAKILEKIAEPIKTGNRLICDLNASLGVTQSALANKSITFSDLLEQGDAAMYFAKQSGKNQYKFFDRQVQEKIMQKRKISTTLRYALNTHAFTLMYMPIYHIESLEVAGAEVLLRCTDPSMEGIGPDQFISVAEEFGMIKEIDLWVIEEVFRIIQSSGLCESNPDFRISVNISAEEMNDIHFPDVLAKLAQQYAVSPACIELEITETRLVDIDASNIDVLQRIRALGFRLALDDFGTGYTAFNQLYHYPVDQLKIDRSFINELHAGCKHAVMVDAILSIANSYQYETVAEGVETQDQLTLLREKGCDLVQGYFLSKPLKWVHFVELPGVKIYESSPSA